MTFGFPAYHRRTATFRLTDAEIMDAVRATCVARGWRIVADEAGHLEARRRLNLWSWGEVIRADIAAGVLAVESRCRAVTQCFDWGVNARNVAEIFEHLPSPIIAALDAAGGASGAPVAVGSVGGVRAR